MKIIKIIAISLMTSMSFNSASFAMNIFDAVKAWDFDKVRALLQADPNVVHAQDSLQMTPLHFAAGRGHVGIVQLLLTHRAAVDARDVNQRTPLHWAAWAGKANAVRLLLEHGAAVDARDKWGNAPLRRDVIFCCIDVPQLLCDWPFHKAYRRRQALAFCMSRHPRLGADSPVYALDQALFRYISEMITKISHTLEEIHRIAEQERNNQ